MKRTVSLLAVLLAVFVILTANWAFGQEKVPVKVKSSGWLQES